MQQQVQSSVRLLLVDDHPVVRQGISSCLARQEHLTIVGEAANGLEALRKAREMLPDIVLMDIEMPQMDGLAVTEILRKELPQMRVLILSMHSHTAYVQRIIQSKAHGYVLKDAPPEDLVRAIDVVQSGEAFFSPHVARLALTRFVRGSGGGPAKSPLTARERQVLILISEGLSNKEVANRLDMAVFTAAKHREHIIRKLDIHSVAGLTKFAISQGLVSLKQEAQATRSTSVLSCQRL
jgi:two-component system nitrate/nitrite response regulator NarL